jgi:hypothetical protein
VGFTAKQGSLFGHTLQKCPNYVRNHIECSTQAAKKTNAAKAVRQSRMIGLAGRAPMREAMIKVPGTNRVVLGLRPGVSNRSGQPTSGPGLDCKNRSARFQTCPKTKHCDCWRAKPGPVPANPRIWPGLARPVGCNLWGCILGFTCMVAFTYATVNCKISTLVRHSSFSTY